MISIDEIMQMLDYRNSEKIQSKGRELSKNIKTINTFIMPMNDGLGVNIWENCALILAEKTDRELEPYLFSLFFWLVDLNWQGALCIYDRLLRFENKEHIKTAVHDFISLCDSSVKTSLFNNLLELEHECDIFD